MTRGRKSRKKMGSPRPMEVVWKLFSLSCSASWRVALARVCGQPVVTGWQCAGHSESDCRTFVSLGRVFHQSQFVAVSAAFGGCLI